ncbi:baseplate assembly protein [Salmonella enterica]|uniref:Baseplate assembly protein n=2 Tax=Salmonella enterica TaxID=28901 RepID=A0A2C9NUP0_SALET|nr:baseplate J/gp47 family protein [Salmonella enterica]EAA5488381.1 baseplate assembly protein [Salmonella enterica subsp. enterica serovar Kouka]ECF6858293.1 baseplate assembly protein [Salmonella enterica subsp. arizonae]ECG5352472.1 baseplate assembly protein [Salmonella enterica subsp. enterica serovar Tennessee]EDW1774226.1 baseplate assembly protein [Salmonella enterica subsp. diarizonae]EDW1845865.1 baseplate assembly protein [Salmonella enterica subsp. enterica]HDP0188915.1 baseplate
MASSYDVINLSELDVPDAIVVPDATEIFTRWLARLRELDKQFDALVESDPTFKQGEVNAYQLTLAFQRVNDAVRAVFLASAKDTDLDQIGAAFNVKRQVIKPGDPLAIPPVEPELEDDSAFRERIQLSWAQLNTAGARNSYRFHAKSADTDVLDADAYGPETHNRPGYVDVYVLSRTGDGTAGQPLLDKVTSTLNADEIRPLTDYVTVKSATIANYAVTAELEIPEGPDASTVLNNAIDVLRSYTTLSHRIKTVLPLSAIYASLQQSGVVRVRLISPVADLEAEAGKAPWCTAINVTRKEVSSNDG